MPFLEGGAEAGDAARQGQRLGVSNADCGLPRTYLEHERQGNWQYLFILCFALNLVVNLQPMSW